MKPFVKSKKSDKTWMQAGFDVTYGFKENLFTKRIYQLRFSYEVL